MTKKTGFIIGVIALVIILDQWLKVYIKLNYSISTGFNILGLDWARIHFVENEGMAFGLSLGGVTGKYILSIFRIFMVGFLIHFLSSIIKSKESYGLQLSFGLIIAGAIGNIIDSMVYGLIFSESCYHCGVAEFMPEGGGYAGFLQGSVVDMFYFPIINSTWPEWVPFFGGDNFAFFRPVFNIADAAISVGVFLIIVFYRSYFLSNNKKPESQKIEIENIVPDQSS
ncbi:MAG: lipoprotein signal peptidase [Saprospiraceae bacterium]|nr:lipoprotein signal peptidase [Bacteroidia bacterium]NNE15348.1 lipoprotein signal peptidase [Saprospiraceae bacterium]NNL92452.1 lipoprotein signal peptidase [Saprospiraceae bacterium]